tara:strand:+ start:1658 stop:1813 length:156 start_codon:yes stop_codon:yes gene_type:complete
MKTYSIVYQNNIMYSNLTIEECGEKMEDLSEKFYSGGSIDPSLIEIKVKEN